MVTAAIAKLGAFIAAFIVPMAEGDASGLDLGSAVTQGLEIVTAVFSFMFSNPICIVLIGLGLVPLGFRMFRSMKNSAGGGK